MTPTLLDQIGISMPIFQAPLAGGGDTPELVAEVSRGGALGFIGCQYLDTDSIEARCARVRSLTKRPFGVNLFAPAPPPENSNLSGAIHALRKYYDAFGIEVPVVSQADTFDLQFEAILRSGARVFSFTCGLVPYRVVERAKAMGMLVFGTATTVAEACALRDIEVDAVIAQGAEAGGHRASFLDAEGDQGIGLMALVPQMVDVTGIPVIASGGIMDGRGIAAALALGAQAAQLGTAFLWCPESGIPGSYRKALRAARDDSTVVTRAFSGKRARGIVNRFLREVPENTAAPFPLQNQLTRPIRDAARRADDADFLSLWAGQAAPLGRPLPAAELVKTLDLERQKAMH